MANLRDIRRRIKSIRSMAKITKELGNEARIYSTRRVNGGIEIIAGAEAL